MEDKYKIQTAPELAGEDSFIRWVRNGEHHQAWLDWQQVSPDRTSIVNEARYIVQLMAGQATPAIDDQAKAALWHRINSDISNYREKSTRQKQNRVIRLSFAVAASIALLFWLNFSFGNKKIYADNGVTAELKLPESSVIVINAGSQIKYNEKMFVKDREIRLDGEAFFKVTPGNKFTVITPQGNVTVVGTSFNVISRPGRFEVSCYTGKVKVDQGPNDKVEITSGQSCRAAHMTDDLQLKTFDPSAAIPGWTTGKFTFEDQPLSVVVNELERQYNVSVKLAPGIENIKYSGFFESGNLQQAVLLITWPLHLEAQISGKTISISR
ncbi:MAG: FecR domain-containing protein [Saprospiraceae bacterium]